MFQKSLENLQLAHYFNQPKNLKDNPVNERFNRILKEEEFLAFGNFHPDHEIFNPRLLSWLEEFIFKRPHQALGYKIPIGAASGGPLLSKMYSSDTLYCI